MSARGAPSPWPATRVGRVAGVSHPHACATPRHHAPAVYARARRVTERDGELVRAVARNRSYKAPIAPPSLRSRARGALYSIRYAYFGWRVSIRLMIHARRNGPGDGPARPPITVYGLRDCPSSRRHSFSAPPGPGGGHPRARTLGAPARALWRTGPDPVHTS